MHLPNRESAIVPEAKIKQYLLSTTHPVGRFKAEFFVRYGFTLEHWDRLADALLQHATDHEIAKVEDSPFGTRFVIEGHLSSPDGRGPVVRSVWFLENGEEFPRLVTAYPLPKD
jgi:hypothetical protein